VKNRKKRRGESRERRRGRNYVLKVSRGISNARSSKIEKLHRCDGKIGKKIRKHSPVQKTVRQGKGPRGGGDIFKTPIEKGVTRKRKGERTRKSAYDNLEKEKERTI